MEYISTNLQKQNSDLDMLCMQTEQWFCCCSKGAIKKFKADDSNLPHEAGHEKTKNKSGLNPALKCDCLCGKTYKAVRQEKYPKY